MLFPLVLKQSPEPHVSQLKVEHTLVLLSTFFIRGKSRMPESRIEIEESRRLREERRDETEEARVVMLWDW